MLSFGSGGSGCDTEHHCFLIASISAVCVKLIMLKDSGSVELHKLIYSELSSPLMNGSFYTALIKGTVQHFRRDFHSFLFRNEINLSLCSESSARASADN